MEASRQKYVEVLGYFYVVGYSTSSKQELQFSTLMGDDVSRAPRGKKVYRLRIPIPPEIEIPEPPVPEIEGEVKLVADEAQ